MDRPIVTYLIGAGASANAVPVVNDLPDRMAEIHSMLQSEEYTLSGDMLSTSQFEDNYEENKKDFLEDLGWLINEAPNYVHIDDYARQLYTTRDQNKRYWTLKATLSTYLMIEQGLKFGAYVVVDPRYRAFIGKLVATDGSLQLNNNVRILNWNYDYQMELAFQSFRSHNSLSSIDNHFQVIPGEGENEFSSDHFSMFKLNGTAGLYEINKSFKHWDLDHEGYDPSKKKHIISLINKTLDFHKHFKSSRAEGIVHFNYAWDEGRKDITFMDNAIEAISKTNHLIIIGYSFPRYNRVIDTELIKAMPKLQAVTIQAPTDSISEIERRVLKLKGGIKPTLVTNTQEFEVPTELVIR